MCMSMMLRESSKHEAIETDGDVLTCLSVSANATLVATSLIASSLTSARVQNKDLHPHDRFDTQYMP